MVGGAGNEIKTESTVVQCIDIQNAINGRRKRDSLQAVIIVIASRYIEALTCINQDQNKEIIVSNTAIKHTATQDHDRVDVRCIGVIDKIIKNAVKIGDLPVDKDEVGGTNAVEVYYCPVNIDGTQYSARLIVKQYENRGNVLDDFQLYDLHSRKEKTGAPSRGTGQNALTPTVSAPVSEYKVKDLIHSTQEYDQKLLGITGKSNLNFAKEGGKFSIEPDEAMEIGKGAEWRWQELRKGQLNDRNIAYFLFGMSHKFPELMHWQHNPVSSKVAAAIRVREMQDSHAYRDQLVDMYSSDVTTPKAKQLIKSQIIDYDYALNFYKKWADGELSGMDYWINDMPKFSKERPEEIAEGPIFYSNAQRAVDDIKQDKATPEQWLAMLTKLGGIKAGEDKWMGLSEWLKSQDKKSLTRDEVLKYIQENQIQVEEENYAENLDIDNNPKLKAIREEFEKIKNELSSERLKAQEKRNEFEAKMREKYGYDWYHKLSDDELKTHDKLVSDVNKIDNTDAGVFDEMVNRHGDDFRMAFHVEGGRLEPEIDYPFGMNDAARYFLGIDDKPINETRLEYTTKGLENKKEIALTVPTIESWNENDEIHFGDAEGGRAIGWIRFGETTDANGNRVSVIDEIQSKRHQEGREKGYKSNFDSAKLERAQKESREYGNYLFNKYIKGQHDGGDFLDYAPDEEKKRFNELTDKVSTIQRLQYGGIPDAPFDKNWQELCMKRMLRYAAENGYDKLAWTTGAQQAERYDIGKVIDQVERNQTFGDTGETRFDLQPKDNSGDISLFVKDGMVTRSSMEEFEGKPLTDVVGKDLAAKMQDMKDYSSMNIADMQIGAEGMAGFYDKILPSFMNKYGKKWGVKVEDIDLPNLGSYGMTMHSVDITPEMKESVLIEGQPMFSKEIGRELLPAKDGVMAEIGGPITRAEIVRALDAKKIKTWVNHKDDVGTNRLTTNLAGINTIARDMAKARLGVRNKYDFDGNLFYNPTEELEFIIAEAKKKGLPADISYKYDFGNGEQISELLNEGKPLYTEQEVKEIKDRLPAGAHKTLDNVLQAFADNKQINEEQERILSYDDGNAFTKALVMFDIASKRLREKYESDDRYFHTTNDFIDAEGNIRNGGRNYQLREGEKWANRRAINTEIADEILRQIATSPITNDALSKTALTDGRFSKEGEKGQRRLVEAGMDEDNLDVAKAMREDGKPALAIKMATGWEYGHDGKWKKENEDLHFQEGVFEKYMPLVQEDKSWISKKLPEVMGDSPLFTAYPMLKDVILNVEVNWPAGLKGAYDKDYGWISLNKRLFDGKPEVAKRNVEEIIAHEVQHIIQDEEGFAKGGNPEMLTRSVLVDNMTTEEKEAYNKTIKVQKQSADTLESLREQSESLKEMSFDKSGYKTIQEFLDTDEAKWQPAVKMMKDLDAEYKATKEEFYSSLKKANKIREKVSQRLGLTGMFLGTDGYYRLAGEVEARSVGSRLNMKPENRRKFLTTYDEDVPDFYQILKFSKEENPDALNKLENEKTVKVYRAIRVNEDGSLASPMAGGGVGGKKKAERINVYQPKLGEWEKADEHPELAAMKDGDEYAHVTIDKGEGNGTLEVAYNPYIHTSRQMLNDQFSSAWRRPNLQVMEVEVPVSELTSGYRADMAKNAVGETEWTDGVVARQLKGDKKRKVILSRWDKPVRIVPADEYAKAVKEQLDGSKVEGIPFNCVTPEQREALVKVGIKILEPEKKAGAEAMKAYEEWKNGVKFSKDEEVVAKKIISTNPVIIETPDSLKENERSIYDLFKRKEEGWRRKVADWALSKLPKSTKTSFGNIEYRQAKIRGALSHGYGDLKMLALPYVDHMFKNGVLYDSHKEDNFTYYNVAHRLSYQGDDYIARLVAREDQNGNLFYDHEFTDIKKIGAPATGREGTNVSTTSPHQLFAKIRELFDSTKLNEKNVSDKSIFSKEAQTKPKDNENFLDYAERVMAEERTGVDTNPTEAQKEAGNYKKGHIRLDGHNITIENPKGSTRSGKDADGKEWHVKMNYDYGYIRCTKGVDGDHIDVYLGPDQENGKVFVVDQIDQKSGKFDEHKVMYGFPDAESAREAYLSQYADGWKVGPVTGVTKEEFKKWIDSSTRKTKPFSKYVSVKPEGDVNLNDAAAEPQPAEKDINNGGNVLRIGDNTVSLQPEDADYVRKQKESLPKSGAWRSDFPQATILTNKVQSRFPDLYNAAKSGDREAAFELVSKLSESKAVADKIAKLVADYPDAIVAYPHAEEAAGRNKIPALWAAKLESEGLKMTDDIRQINRPNHTGAADDGRLVRRSRFEGNVEKGGKYILLDDQVSSGATLRDMKDYIESQGGEVVQIVGMTASMGGHRIAPSEEHINRLNELGVTDKQLQDYGIAESIRHLTDGEAAKLVRLVNRRGAGRAETGPEGNGSLGKGEVRRAESKPRAGEHWLDYANRVASEDRLAIDTNPTEAEDNIKFSKEDTHTKNFKNWFGDWEKDPKNASKVVDADGKPLVVYKRMWEKKNVIEAKWGTFFSDEPIKDKSFGNYVGKYYLDIKNPLVMDAGGVSWSYPMWRLLANENEELPETQEQFEQVVKDKNLLRWAPKEIWEIIWKSNDEFDFEDAGYLIKEYNLPYDGVIIKDIAEGQLSDQYMTDYIVMEPTQIKSATENNGDYDTNNPDIRFSKEGKSAEWKKAKEELKDYPFAQETLRNLEDQDIYDVAASVLAGGNLLWGDKGEGPNRKKGVAAMMGWKEGERKNFLGMFAKDGMSFAQAGEAVEQACRELHIPYDENDPMAGVNALQEVLGSVRSMGELTNYVELRRVDEARAAVQDAQNHMAEERNQYYLRNYGMSYDEYMTYQEESAKAQAGKGISEEAQRDINWLKTKNERQAQELQRIQKELDRLHSEELARPLVVAQGKIIEQQQAQLQQAKAEASAAREELKWKKDYREAYKQLLEVKADVANFVREQLAAEDMPFTSKRELNKLLATIEKTNTTEQLQDALREVQTVTGRSRVKHLEYQLDKLLRLQIQGLNGKRMSVAKTVDDRTRRIIEDIRGRVQDIGISGMEEKLDGLMRERREQRGAINELRTKLKDAEAEEKVTLQAKIDEGEKHWQELSSQIQAKADEISEARESKRSRSVEDLTEEINAIIEQADLLAQEGKQLPEAEADKLTALEGFKILQQSKKSANDVYELEKAIRDLWSKIYELRAEREGKDDKERQRLNKLIINRKDKIKANEALLVDALEQQAFDIQEGINMLETLMDEGRNSLKQKTDAALLRRCEMIKNAWADVRNKRKQVNYNRGSNPDIKDNPVWKMFINAPIGSFEYMAQRLGQTGKYGVPTGKAGKDSWIYQHFVTGKDGVMEAFNTYQRGLREQKDQLNEKVTEIFGTENNKLKKIVNKAIHTDAWVRQAAKADKIVYDSGVTVKKEDGGREVLPISKGAATYLYMVWKMEDGKSKMMLQGFDNTSMQEIQDFIGKDYMQLADWLQDTFLVGTRAKYNERYRELYNTSMAKIKFYVPLKVNKDATRQESDLSDDKNRSQTLEQRAGSLINRRVNQLPVDITKSVFDVISEHVEQMENWYAYSPVRRDLDAILSNTFFRNQVDANNAGHFRRFYDAAAIATQSYIPPAAGGADVLMGMMTKGLLGGNIAWRAATAIKQLYSASAYLGYTYDPMFVPYLMKNTATAVLGINFQWCMDNIPSFRARVDLGDIGNVRISERVGDLSGNVAKKLNKYLQNYMAVGMIPNRLIDALTCSIGAKSIYDYKIRQLKLEIEKDKTLTNEQRQEALKEAHRKAVMEADIFYNSTQQSSNPMFLSPMQVSRTLLDRSMTAYQNNNLGYVRKTLEAAYDMIKSVQYQKMKEAYKQSYIEDGIPEEEATAQARRQVLKTAGKGLLGLFVMGWLNKYLWDRGSTGFFGFWADPITNPQQQEDNESDEEYKNRMEWESFYSWIGLPARPLQGTPMGNYLVSVSDKRNWNPLLIFNELDDLKKDFDYIMKNDGVFSKECLWAVINHGMRTEGINLETLGNIYYGLEQMAIDGGGFDEKMIDLMFILNNPNKGRVDAAKNLYKDEDFVTYAQDVAKANKYLTKGTALAHFFPWMKEFNGDDANGKQLKKEYDKLKKEWEAYHDIDFSKPAGVGAETTKIYNEQVKWDDIVEDGMISNLLREVEGVNREWNRLKKEDKESDYVSSVADDYLELNGKSIAQYMLINKYKKKFGVLKQRLNGTTQDETIMDDIRELRKKFLKEIKDEKFLQQYVEDELK